MDRHVRKRAELDCELPDRLHQLHGVVDHTAIDRAVDPCEVADVLERVRVEDHEIRAHARRDAPDGYLHPECARAVHGRAEQDLLGCEAGRARQREFAVDRRAVQRADVARVR